MLAVDADKPSNSRYLDLALGMVQKGSIIIVDNVIRSGDVIDENSSDARVHGSREVIRAIGEHPRLEATALQTVGAKGHDGFVMAIVKD